MKTLQVLCPIDFSAHSKAALLVAVELCKKMEAQLHILNTFQLPQRAANLVNLDDVIKDNTQQDFDILMAGISQDLDPDRPPITAIKKGETVKTISNYAKKAAIDLIIMGTQGSNSLRTRLFGSVTKKILDHAPCPVLGIPDEFTFEHLPKSIILALDGDMVNNTAAMEILVRMSKAMDCKVDIFHLSSEPETLPFDPFVLSILGENSGEIIIKDGKDPIAAIKKIADERDYGIVAMIHHEQATWKRWVLRSDSKDQMGIIQRPLLIIND